MADKTTTATPRRHAETQVRVRYADTDAMGVAYHANYLIWFEQGRTELMRALGYPYRQLEADGLMLPVTEAQVRYVAAAYYDDLLTVRSELAELRSRQLVLEYTVVNQEGQLLASGRTLHIVTDRHTRRPARLPQRLV